MARATHLNPIMAFRFTAAFFNRVSGEDDQGRRTTDIKPLNDPTKLGFTSVGVSSRGFEVWRGLFYDEPSIFPIIGEADMVECVAYGRPSGRPRDSGEVEEVQTKIFRFSLVDGSVHLPMAVDPMIVGAKIGQERGFDSISSSIVMEGVLWPSWKLVSITDKMLPLPQG